MRSFLHVFLAREIARKTNMWQTQTTKLPRIKFPEFRIYVRDGGPELTADLNLKNRFKFVTLLGSSCFPLENLDSTISVNCIM